MKILITGATGFIGSHLLHCLVELKHDLVIVKRKSSDTWRINDVMDKCTVYDIDNVGSLKQVFEENKIDLIIHLATKYYRTHKGIDDIRDMVESNIVFPSSLLDIAVKNNVKFFINTGTCFEDRLFNYYATTKLSFENVLKYYSSRNPLKALTLKLFYPYGEKDNDKLVTLIIKSLLNNKQFDLTRGEQRLNFTYVDDIINAFVKSLKYIHSGNYRGYDKIDIGNDHVVSIKRIVSVLQKIHKSPGKINLGRMDYPPNEIMYMNCKSDKAKKLLDWSPKIDVEKGLRSTYNYYIKHEI